MLEFGEDRMPRIRIVPIDIEIEAADGMTVMGAAQDAGYYWPTTCGGEGRCTTCACDIVEGAAGLSAMGRSEQKTLVEERGEAALLTSTRLACQARVRGNVMILVRKPGVRRPVDAG
jgi:2Fe-2S ferredoxin